MSTSPVVATSLIPFDGEVAVGTLELAPVPALTATIDWGDGAAISVGTVNVAAGIPSVSGTHTYTGVGVRTGTGTVTEPATELKTSTTFGVVAGGV